MDVTAGLEPSSLLAADSAFQEAHLPAPPLSPAAKAKRYCLLLLLIPLAAIPACIGLGGSNFFLQHGASIWVRSNDAVFGMRDRQCDVLVFGDSTAMTGINPEVVERDTGFKTCNIAVTNSVLAVTGTLTLDRFLEHNARPRVLLIQLSPDGFDPKSYSWRNTVYAEGLVELMRHAPAAESRRVLLRHPKEAIAFAGYVAGFTAYAALKDIGFRAVRMRPDEDGVTIHNGFFTPPMPPSTSCESSDVFGKPPAASSFPRSVVASYERQYANRAGVVLVNVAPIPSCDRNLAAYSTELSGVTSNPLTKLPVGLFNDPLARHYTAIGSAVVSRLVAEELNAAVAGKPAVQDRSLSAPARSTLANLHPVEFRKAPDSPPLQSIASSTH